MPAKIATAEDVQAELKTLLAMTEEPEPSRAKLAEALSDLANKVAGVQPIKYYIGPHYIQVYSVFESYGRVHHVTGDLNEIEGKLIKIRGELLDLYRASKDKAIVYPDVGEVIVDGVPGGRNKMIVYFTLGMQGMSEVTDAHLSLLDRVLGRYPDEKPPVRG